LTGSRALGYNDVGLRVSLKVIPTSPNGASLYAYHGVIKEIQHHSPAGGDSSQPALSIDALLFKPCFREGTYLSVNLQREVYISYEDMADEQIVDHARLGDRIAEEYLINKYKNFVRAKARSYFLIGADREDIIQEGMIGLYKAIRDFRSDKLASFRAFAELCITRQIITAIKTATRQKHIPLNSYVSLNKPIYDEESDRTLLDVLSGNKVTDPEELVISREEFVDIESKMGEFLSELEREVLNAYLDGKSYQEIAQELNRHVKSIDNALQRVKRKLERYIEKRNE
jgi:RNA polymerase sporulation-specific sigma factor